MNHASISNSTEYELVELAKRENSERIKDFSEILNKIENLDDQKKQLWKEIYENCLSDRQNAYAFLLKLSEICKSKSTEWAIHGRTLVSFQERMNKTVDQLLKLADLIHKAEEADDVINPDDVYDQLKK